jgi:hypothetical protein
VQQFLRFTEYYWYFVPNYSKIAWLLLNLTKKGPVWHWERPQHDAFEELRVHLVKKFPHMTLAKKSETLRMRNFAEKWLFGVIFCRNLRMQESVGALPKIKKNRDISRHISIFIPAPTWHDVTSFYYTLPQ